MIQPQQHLSSTRIIKTRLYKVFPPHECASLNFYLVCLPVFVFLFFDYKLPVDFPDFQNMI